VVVLEQPRCDQPVSGRVLREAADSGFACALSAQTQLVDRSGNGLSHSHLVNLAAGRELPSRRALGLLASAFQLPPAYFAEYRLAELRRQLDEREVGSPPPTAPTKSSADDGRSNRGELAEQSLAHSSTGSSPTALRRSSALGRV
jgi:transcriptional regulator with XRE-family HTH domain